MEKKEKLKLREVTDAINNLDKATAACSYGSYTTHMFHVVPLLPKENRVELAALAGKMAKDYLAASKKKLEDLNIDPGTNPRPEEYRLNGKRNTDEGPG